MTVSAYSPVTRALLALFLALGLLTALAVPLTAHAYAAPLRYIRGYSIQGNRPTWLCYGWGNGAYHCTAHWRRSGSRVLSLNPAWVPNYGNYAAPAPAAQPAPSPAGSLPLRTAICQWCAPGYGSFRAAWGAVKGYAFGNCTAGAAALASYIPAGLGNAKDWIWNAIRRGLPTGSSPRVGATVVFQPFVQGAGWLGHVAHVVGVYGGGWFMVEEEYFGWNGGGFERMSFRYAHTGPGVSFIYA